MYQPNGASKIVFTCPSTIIYKFCLPEAMKYAPMSSPAYLSTYAYFNKIILRFNKEPLILTLIKVLSQSRIHLKEQKNIETCTYVYHGQASLSGSLRKAPVIPDTGMKIMSVLGLKPHFLRYGTSLSLHSLYLKIKPTNCKSIEIKIYR